MFEDLRDPGDRPGVIDRFVQLWLAAIAVSAVVAIWMFDYSITVAGVRGALAVNAALFGAAIVLLLLIARRRSNLARWLLTVPFNLLIVLYDLAHIEVEMREALGFVALLRLGLMAAATWQLFTPSARAWFRATQGEGD